MEHSDIVDSLINRPILTATGKINSFTFFNTRPENLK